MAPIEADIEEITRTLWSTLFDLSLDAVSPAPDLGGPAAAGLGGEAIVTACVQIVGQWRGAVVLRCPMPLARTLAEQMYQAESAPTLDEVRDALGELTNVIGGNVKALFPGPSRISLPTVAVGSDYKLRVMETKSMIEVPFICDGQPMLVTLYAGPADTETSRP
jgi:chemotaxis protein CheX